MNKTALILTDLQNDFCKGGRLAVPESDAIIPLANQLQKYFDIVVATKDWHPQDHISFASNHPEHKVGDIIIVDGIPQRLWPDHCVQKSKGSDFQFQLDTTHINKVIHKGIDKTIDSYSAFFNNKHLHSTGLNEYLHQQNVNVVYIMGLTTDYCVKYSCLDAIKLGFEVYLIEDACRGIGLKQGDIIDAINAMKAAGVNAVKTKEVMQQ